MRPHDDKSATRPTLLRRLGRDLSPTARVFCAFFFYAFAIGGIFTRLGEVQRALGVGEATLGRALIGVACGTLLSLTFTGPWLERLGHRRVLLTLGAALPVCYAVAVHAAGPIAFFLLLVPAGLVIGVIEIVVNLEADRVEHESGRRSMNRAHAFWSVGFFAAGAFGALVARLGLSPAWHLALVVPLQWLGIALALGRFEAAPPRPRTNDAATARFARPTRGVLALVVFTLAAMLLEGAGNDWAAIYMRDVFGASAVVGGLAVAAGGLAQGLVRFVADGFVARHGPVAVARVLLGVLGTGALTVFLAPAGAVALLGFAAIGAGTSAIFPLAMSAAAQRGDRAAATNVAALAQLSFVAFLLGPPWLGMVAERFGIRWVFGVGLPLVGLSALATGALRRR